MHGPGARVPPAGARRDGGRRRARRPPRGGGLAATGRRLGDALAGGGQRGRDRRERGGAPAVRAGDPRRPPAAACGGCSWSMAPARRSATAASPRAGCGPRSSARSGVWRCGDRYRSRCRSPGSRASSGPTAFRAGTCRTRCLSCRRRWVRRRPRGASRCGSPGSAGSPPRRIPLLAVRALERLRDRGRPPRSTCTATGRSRPRLDGARRRAPLADAPRSTAVARGPRRAGGRARVPVDLGVGQRPGRGARGAVRAACRSSRRGSATRRATTGYAELERCCVAGGRP